jgi:hypothetical protein
MILRQKMSPFLRVQPPGAEWERNQEPAPGSADVFPFKSGGVGVYTGGSVDPKRAFALIERLFVIASAGGLRYHIDNFRRHGACVFMNSAVKGI